MGANRLKSAYFNQKIRKDLEKELSEMPEGTVIVIGDDEGEDYTYQKGCRNVWTLDYKYEMASEDVLHDLIEDAQNGRRIDIIKGESA